MAVPNFANEYQLAFNGEAIEIQYGRVDVSVWLDEQWHPLRFAGVLNQDVMNLRFETTTGHLPAAAAE